MSRLVARLLLSVMILPLGSIAYLCTGMMLIATDILDEEPGMMASGLITWAAVSICWILLWRSSVNWTPAHMRETIASFIASAIVGVLVGVVIAILAGELNPVVVLASGVVMIVVWLVASVFLWQETREERQSRLRAGGADAVLCPVCRYNMTGLHETTCPECGGRFTLSELVSTSAGHDVG